jgi:hypothetical protein
VAAFDGSCLKFRANGLVSRPDSPLVSMRISSKVTAITALVLTLASATSKASGHTVTAPLVCSRGPEGQTFRAVVTLPVSQPTGSKFMVRIDSFSSGRISHLGLKYIFDMATEYRIPAGTKYVEGSARVVPNTGTANARSGARAWHDAAAIHLLLPARVENGGSYTPPSLEFQLEITAAAGTELMLKFSRSRVSANVFLLGDVHTTCVPKPRPYTIGKTRAVPPAIE